MWIAWIYILVRAPYRVRDRIKIGEMQQIAEEELGEAMLEQYVR